ncbi:helix-turn-helix domain-containing protein [Streptomyces zagrosensis]|uniref:Transcriptional regulator with XRE-family HTH domain n=1 Tax=Streptomyces zagrosensis TaxID=1042984 RepID=A0A7W9Q6N0_9ACTN|nr:helix-turn-helix transcriptional regulator [Streptomyces zagrosensis]MBB5934594.1 transcriptional regulator with XRE-family HTH domain [Streptomyces zagrosensis]
MSSATTAAAADAGLSPQEFYGKELARRREAKGFTQESLAERIFISAQMIAHWEAGRRRPRAEDARRLDEVLGTDGLFYRMRRDLVESRFADHFNAAAELEGEATLIRLHGITLVPGLLQTTEYARAVYRAGSANPDPRAIEKLVDDRIQRASLIREPDGPIVWAMLDEAVIRRQVGSRAVMAEQLQHIADLGRRGRVRVHVLPFDRGAHALLESMLVLLDFSDDPGVAYVEGLRTGRLLDEPGVVDDCRAAYALALGDALSADESMSLLEMTAEEFQR